MNFLGSSNGNDAPRADDAATPSGAKPPGRWPTEPDYWRLWFIGTLQFGIRWLDALAIGVFAYQHTGSALLVTTLTMLRILPMALFGVFAGAAADRLEGRSLLLATVGLSFTTSLVMAVLAETGYLEIWHLAVAAFVSGITWAADIPLRRLMVGRVIGADRVANAMAIEGGSNNASRIAGPAIGGTVLATWGIGGCFLIGAALYLAAFFAAFFIRYRNPVRTQSGGFFLGNIQAAIKLSLREKPLAGYFVVTVVFNLFGLPILSLVPVIGQDYLGLGPRGIGILASMDGVGAICGALLILFFSRPTQYAHIYVYSVLGYVIMLSAMALMPYATLAGLALLIAGLGSAGFGIMQSTLIFHSMKPEMRASLLGLLTVTIGMGPLGLLQIGLLAEVLGAQLAILISGAEGLLAMLLTRSLWREIGTAKA